jgi:hypothetical protein
VSRALPTDAARATVGAIINDLQVLALTRPLALRVIAAVTSGLRQTPAQQTHTNSV